MREVIDGMKTLNNSILSLVYSETFTFNKLIIGFTEEKSAGTFNVDVIREDKQIKSFNVHRARFIKNRYLVMDLVMVKYSTKGKTDLFGTEVIDTLTGKELTAEICQKTKYTSVSWFLCDGGIPYAGLFSNDDYLRCVIMNDETFEIINSEFVDIRNESMDGNLYQFEAANADDFTLWRQIKMDKRTGEIIESKHIQRIERND